VVLSTCGGIATGPVAAGFPLAGVGATGVSVIPAPVPAADVEPSTVGAPAATVTL
jgi:hypothetical protein